jgi:DNA-binding response OmpR family regulator
MQRPILVVDDDVKIVRLVRTYLEREGFAVTSAHTGREALAAFREQPPALIVLDLMLPEMDGIAVCRQVRATSDVPVLMLSARSAVTDRIRGIEEGADDYLPKPFSPAELVVRVKAILRRAEPSGVDPLRGPPTETILRHADLTLDVQRHEVRRGTQLLSLTHVEFRLLATLLAADGRVLTRDQLLDAVYGQDDGEVLDRTIDVHVGRLRERLGDDAERPRYVATVRGVGYRAAPR